MLYSIAIPSRITGQLQVKTVTLIRKRGSMVAPLDVFAVKNRETKWLGCVETVAQATELIRNTGFGSYFVFSQQTGHKNFYEVTSEGVVFSVSALAS